MTVAITDRREKLRNRAQGWFLEPLLEIFEHEISDPLSAEASELIRKRRVLDFSVQPGSASAKVLGEKPQPQKIELHFPVLTDQQWDSVFDTLAQQAYFLALMLLGKVPPEIEQVFAQAGAELIPQTKADFSFTIDGQPQEQLSAPTAALLLKLFERLEGEPFLLIVLHGRGREETLAELRKRRSLLKSEQPVQTAISAQDVQYEKAPPLLSTTAHYWSAGSNLHELEYSIRADELPASILRWLDPVPLAGLEDQVDFLLEEAYEMVTRLAQGYGLGL